MNTSNSTWETEIALSNNYVTVILYIVDGIAVAKQSIYYSDDFGNRSTIERI